MRHRKPLTRAGWLVRIAGCAGALIGAVGLAGAVGPSGLSWSALGTDDPVARSILLEVRLPRILLAATLGAALSLAGAIFQALLRNPLADPYVLGVSGGASLGGVLALSLGGSLLGGLGVGVSAFLGALLALWLIATIATRGGRIDVLTLLLTGAIFNAFSGALIFFVQSVASRREVHEIVFFLMGRLPPLRPAALLGLGLIVLARPGTRQLVGARLQRLDLRRGDRTASRRFGGATQVGQFRARRAADRLVGGGRRDDRFCWARRAPSLANAVWAGPSPAISGQWPGWGSVSGGLRRRRSHRHGTGGASRRRRHRPGRRAVLPAAAARARASCRLLKVRASSALPRRVMPG